MTRILLVTSSPRGPMSYSTRVARSLTEALLARHPGAHLTVRDLANEPLPHIGADFVAGLTTPPERRTAAQGAAIALSDEIIAEVRHADVVVIASAMINFGMSSTLKTWFDYLLRAGVTFKYTERGPEGLMQGKKAYIVEARGGVYSEGPMQVLNFQEPHLRQLLGFIGITDVEALSVEGVALGADVAEKAFASALAQISALSASGAISPQPAH